MNNLNVLEAYELEMVEMEEQYEVKNNQKNKMNRHKINKINKFHDRSKSCSHSDRKARKFLKNKAKKKLRYVPIGEEEFMLRGCSFHKVYEWRYDL